jgi:hypothetical protein
MGNSTINIPKGEQGPSGADGATGPAVADGVDGQGVPTGGSTGQVLAKIDGTDFNTEWVDQSGGSPPTGGLRSSCAGLIKLPQVLGR